MEDIPVQIAGDRTTRVAQGSGQAIGTGADQPPAAVACRLPLLLNPLIENEGAIRVHPAAAIDADRMASGQDHPHGPLAMGSAKEEMLR